MTPILYYAFILPISLLPFRLLYFFSDGLSWVIFHVVKYRRTVVFENLRRSFPEKSDTERESLAREFYRHFADLIVESFKGFTISDAEVRKRFVVLNPEILDSYFQSGRSVILAGGHYNNWEWFALGLPLQIRHQTDAIYKPLSNSFLEGKMRETRSRFGLRMIPIRDVPDFFRSPQASPNAVIFGADQSPGDPRKAHWLTFLGQETGVAFGAEKYAREYGLPVIFAVIHKQKRGYYTLRFEEITDRPSDLPTGAVVSEVSRRLESVIRSDPRYWLWTHRRWKHSRPK